MPGEATATTQEPEPPEEQAEPQASIADALVSEWKMAPEKAQLFDLMANWLGRSPQPILMALQNDLGGLLEDDLLVANLRSRIAGAEVAEEMERAQKRRPPPPPIVYPEPVSVEERLAAEYGLAAGHIELLSLLARYFRQHYEAQIADTLQSFGSVWASDQSLIQILRERLNLPPS